MDFSLVVFCGVVRFWIVVIFLGLGMIFLDVSMWLKNLIFVFMILVLFAFRVNFVR